MEREDYVQVVAMDAASAIAFFGFGPEARAIDAGPADPERWRQGARVWHVYQTPAELPS
jgi:hypothetical protein